MIVQLLHMQINLSYYIFCYYFSFIFLFPRLRIEEIWIVTFPPYNLNASDDKNRYGSQDNS